MHNLSKICKFWRFFCFQDLHISFIFRIFVHDFNDDLLNVTIMAKSIEQKQRETLGKEVMNIILSRSGVTRQDVVNTAMHNFCRNNIDLLTVSERKKYASVIL